MDPTPAQADGSLREYRRRAGLTQRALAERSGVSIRAVRDLEHGRVRRPRPSSVRLLAAALDLSASEYDRLMPAGSSPANGRPCDRLRVGVLGPLVLYRDGRPLDVPAGKLRQLLGLLALHANQPIHVEEIIDVLWAEDAPARCRNMLHSYVTRLRRLLGPAGGRILTYGSAGYRLALQPDELDVAVFDAHAERYRQHRVAGQPEAAFQALAAALDGWRGPVLGDLDSVRQHPIAAAIEQRHVAAVLGFAELASDLGRDAQAIDQLRVAVRAQPLHERLHARLMLTLGAAGQQAAAVSVFNAIRSRLDSELGLGPGPELRAALASTTASSGVAWSPEHQHLSGGTVAESIAVARPEVAFCRLLRFERQRAHLTQAQLARLSGLGIRTINDLEQGRVSRPRRESVRLLGDALGLRSELRRRFERAAGGPELLAPGQPTRRPSDLPPDLADFTGRADEIARLMADLTGAAPHGPVAGICGKGGVGKTALAVHIGHRLSGAFPDGHLFVNLGGMGGRTVIPEEALARLLLLLGVDRADIPPGLDSRMELYRACLADSRVFVLLDNAADESQVRSLLPVGEHAAGVVTSRRPLAGLEAMHWLSLSELDDEESVELLARVAGVDRVRSEPTAAARIVRLCGNLPLAIRIAGAKLAVRPHWALWELAERLTGEERRLDELRVGDLAVRASFALSYEALDRPARRVFRALGVLTSADFPAWLPATLVGRDVTEVGDVLERLVELQLLDACGRDPARRRRYRLHDLLALFARERLRAEESTTEGQAGLGRALGSWLTVVDSVEARLVSGLPGGVAGAPAGGSGSVPVAGPIGLLAAGYPLDWLPAQRAALAPQPLRGAAAAPAPPDGGGSSTFWELGWGVTGTLVAMSFELWSHWDDWRMTQDVALVAGRRVGDRLSAAPGTGRLGVVLGRCDPWGQVVADLEGCVRVFAELGEWRWHAMTEVSLGNLYRAQARPDTASSTLESCVNLFRQLGHHGWEAASLLSLGSVYVVQDRLVDAVDCYRRCSIIFDERGDRLWRAYTQRALGFAYQQHERFREAASELRQCLTTFRERGDRMWEAHTMLTLGYAERGMGRFDDACSRLTDCLSMFHEIGDKRSEAMTWRGLAAAERGRGDPTAAFGNLQASLALFRELGDPVGVANTLYSLGRHCRTVAADADAASYFASSLELFRDLGLLGWEVKARQALGQ